jgi:hypothetical protein
MGSSVVRVTSAAPCTLEAVRQLTFIATVNGLGCLAWGADMSHADAIGCIDINDWPLGMPMHESL